MATKRRTEEQIEAIRKRKALPCESCTPDTPTAALCQWCPRIERKVALYHLVRLDGYVEPTPQPKALT